MFQYSFTKRTVPVPVSVSGKRFRRFWFRVRFLQKRFRQFQFPVPARFLGHPEFGAPSIAPQIMTGRTSIARELMSMKPGTKNQPKEEVLGTDIQRTSGGHLRGHPGPKLRSGPSKYWKTSIWARTSMIRRRGRPRPQGISKNFGQKNFGLNFRSHYEAWQEHHSLGCTQGGHATTRFLVRVLRRLFNSKCFLEGFLEGAFKGFQ